MDVQTELDLAAAIRKVDAAHRLGAAQLAEGLVAELNDTGYALVKLPQVLVDEDRFPYVSIESIDKWADVFIRRTDGRIAVNAVPNPLDSPEDAMASAAALIAAARHVQENRDA
jgi:hypothetical protein